MSELSDAELFDQAEAGPGPDWMQVTVVAPSEVAHAVMEFLKREHRFRDIAPIDWCVLERREDFSHVSYAPCEPIARNAYVVEWRKGEGRGDVVVAVEPQDTP